MQTSCLRGSLSILLALVGVGLGACSSDRAAPQQGAPDSGDGAPDASQADAVDAAIPGVDVYATGWESNGTTDLAKYWKNGSPTSLTNGSKGHMPLGNVESPDAVAYALAVSGTDVYVAGYEFNGTQYVAIIWKNGVPTPLTDGTNDSGAT